MATSDLRQQVEALLDRSDVRIDGHRPWDVVVHDPRFHERVLSEGTIGLAEAYADGWWDCDRIDEFVCRLQRARVADHLEARPAAARSISERLKHPRGSRTTVCGGLDVEIGCDLLEAMLDRRMVESCALWRKAADLDTAQEHKLEMVARKLRLQPGMRVLEIGSGWGGTARYLAEEHGAHVVAMTESPLRRARAADACAGLPVEVRLGGFRDVHERFHRILMLGTIDRMAVGDLDAFFSAVERLLVADGLVLLQTTGSSCGATQVDPWVEREISSREVTPTARDVAAAHDGRMVLEHWENLGIDQDHTLMAWHGNVFAAWSDLRDRYDERFRRAWQFHLLASAGTFRARRCQVWQMVFSPEGVRGGYRPSPQRSQVIRDPWSELCDAKLPPRLGDPDWILMDEPGAREAKEGES